MPASGLYCSFDPDFPVLAFERLAQLRMRGFAIEDFLVIWAIRIPKEGSGVFGKKTASSIDRLKR